MAEDADPPVCRGTRPAGIGAPGSGVGTGMTTIELTEQTFEQTVTDSDIVLVDWWADWCGPCKQFAPVYDEAAEQHEDVVFGKVDTESEQSLAAAAQITSIPTLMAFREGILVFSQAGALPPDALEQVITGVKGLDMDEVRKEVETQQQPEQEQAGPPQSIGTT